MCNAPWNSTGLFEGVVRGFVGAEARFYANLEEVEKVWYTAGLWSTVEAMGQGEGVSW